MRPFPLLHTPVVIAKWLLIAFATGVIAFNVHGAAAHNGMLTRAAAIILLIYVGHNLWLSLHERRIEHYGNFPSWAVTVFRRDSTPILYWTTVGLEIAGLIGFLIVAIFGW